MTEQVNHIVNAFGVSADKVFKEKSGFICETAGGPFILYKSREDAERVVFQHEVKEELARAGFPQTDRYVVTPGGEPFVRDGGEIYVMTRRVESAERNFAQPDDIINAVETAALFHKHARGAAFTCRVFVNPVPLTAQFEKQSVFLNSTHRRVSRQNRLSDFDVLFIKHAPYYTERARRASSMLASGAYAALREAAVAGNHICHNALKEENMPFDRSESVAYVAQFEHACVDAQINDLSALIRRHAQKAGENAVPASQLIEKYDSVFPISKEEADALDAMLLYPQPFIKAANQYYNRKRTWAPSAIVAGMEEALKSKETYEKYIGK